MMKRYNGPECYAVEHSFLSLMLAFSVAVILWSLSMQLTAIFQVDVG